jgi:hypothetical protein
MVRRRSFHCWPSLKTTPGNVYDMHIGIPLVLKDLYWDATNTWRIKTQLQLHITSTITKFGIKCYIFILINCYPELSRAVADYNGDTRKVAAPFTNTIVYLIIINDSCFRYYETWHAPWLYIRRCLIKQEWDYIPNILAFFFWNISIQYTYHNFW